MKRIRVLLCFFLLTLALPVQALGAEYLVPVGRVIGLQLRSDRVTVAAFDEALGDRAREAGIKIGDEIVAVNGKPVDRAEDVPEYLALEPGLAELTVRRGLGTHRISLQPRNTAQGPKLGIHLRQGIAGIGTVTWYDPETGLFGALGHGVNTSGGGLLEMTEGGAYEAGVLAVEKGKKGSPGQLRGTAEELRLCGTLLRNTPQGVFGISREGWPGQALPVGEYSGVHTGQASIRSTVAGNAVQEYSVEILKIYPQDRADGRNFLLRITDPALLSATGGIVQGMSGSPIIQDGKLVGAVTHVLVNDPTRGYGIFIENMLNAAR